VEIAECIETLKGRGPADLEELSILLAARMLVVAGIVSEEAEARRRVREALRSGAGVEVLRRVIERQGGDPRVMHDYDRLPRASGREIISASRDGYLRTLNAEWVGRASVALGAGRNRVDEAVDPAAGILVRATPGERVKQGQPLLELLFNKPPNLETARGFAEAAIDIGDEAPTIRPLVVERISSS
jgi:thymidine phosphorylase